MKLDDSDRRPGFKFADCEMRGIPLRIEIGPKDIEAGQCVLVRRDSGEKITAALDALATAVPELLEAIQRDMYEKAKAHRDAHTYDVQTMEEFADTVKNRPGFVRAMWCGCRECEDKIKEQIGATSRCIPFRSTRKSPKASPAGRGCFRRLACAAESRRQRWSTGAWRIKAFTKTLLWIFYFQTSDFIL